LDRIVSSKIDNQTIETTVARSFFVPVGNNMYIPGWYSCFIKYLEFYYLYSVKQNSEHIAPVNIH